MASTRTVKHRKAAMERSTRINMTLSRRLLVELDNCVGYLRATQPGVTITRSQVIQKLLSDALMPKPKEHKDAA
jgi:hypothetical protein